jgi:hypothetical protein
MMPQDIELHIEELILHGFAAKDRNAIAGAVQHELQRLFAEQGVPQQLEQSRTVGRLNTGPFTVQPGSRAETIGAQVAQTVYEGLGQTEQSRRKE